jgi:hypothetical protein
MPDYTIQNFWRARLPVTPAATASLVPGWSVEREGFATFKEAPLALNTELSSDDDPQRSSILLVSAPGAVGKSTLARQIAFVTGAVYVDLAKADPVGGNTMSGGLVKSGLYPNWQSETTALLIDGLDEARLRVTQEAFEAFLGDVVQLSAGRTLPTVLFGRTGAIQDAWLLLSNGTARVAVLEIGYYGPEASVDFAYAMVRSLRPGNPHTVVERQAVEALLERLRAQTEVDGDRFAGYAPVLLAVAERVARENNPAALVAQIENGVQPVTLQGVVFSILRRERSKLEGLQFEDSTLAQKLYLPEEQLDRLVARIYHLPPPGLPAMNSLDAHTYSTALDTWVGEHPFLNGGHGASSAVFEAIISVRALKNPSSAEAAVQRELRRGAAANPFLSEFYLPEDAVDDRRYLPPGHVGIVYASLRAQLSLGDTASLLVEGPEDAEEEEALRAEVEITLARRDADGARRVLRFDTEQTDVLRLGGHVEDVDLTVPHTRVEIGPGPEAVLIAPVSVQCQQLAIVADKITIECPPGLNDAVVFLEADGFSGARITSVPVLRGNVSLAVAWPGAQAHPWTSFATDPTPNEDPRVDEALRRFRKIVMAFRSHSKGSLARYKYKIEHERMTKGSGKKILALMLSENIISLNGSMYFLDPVRLGERVGATYVDCAARQFSARTLDFVRRSLEMIE